MCIVLVQALYSLLICVQLFDVLQEFRFENVFAEHCNISGEFANIGL